jgi:hypothetical protein
MEALRGPHYTIVGNFFVRREAQAHHMLPVFQSAELLSMAPYKQ